jgi:hypothetical protein
MTQFISLDANVRMKSTPGCRQSLSLVSYGLPANEDVNAANRVFASVFDTAVMQRDRVLHLSRCFVNSMLFEDVL